MQQLLAKAPQLLRQLVAITAAALQQLAAQRASEVKVSQSAAMLIDSLAWLLQWIRARPDTSMYTPSAPADTDNLRLLHYTGVHQAPLILASALQHTHAAAMSIPAASQHDWPA